MKRHPAHEPNGGFSRTRRELLGFIGANAAMLASGTHAKAALAAPERALPRCVVRPEQTEGPYFLDERLQRADLRSDPESGSVKPGAPLRLAFRVSQVDGKTCRPWNGAVVDVWQCDAAGVYSGVRDFGGRFDTRGQSFLRGYQLTDANGVAQFMTIYPGWYPGRAVHIHFKIRAPAARGNAYEFTSQLYFDDAMTDRIHARSPYVSHGMRRTRNPEDGLFRRGGERLMLRVDPDVQGFEAAFDIGLLLAGGRRAAARTAQGQDDPPPGGAPIASASSAYARLPAYANSQY